MKWFRRTLVNVQSSNVHLQGGGIFFILCSMALLCKIAKCLKWLKIRNHCGLIAPRGTCLSDMVDSWIPHLENVQWMIDENPIASTRSESSRHKGFLFNQNQSESALDDVVNSTDTGNSGPVKPVLLPIRDHCLLSMRPVPWALGYLHHQKLGLEQDWLVLAGFACCCSAITFRVILLRRRGRYSPKAASTCAQ